MLGIAHCAKDSTGEIIYEERVSRADQMMPRPFWETARVIVCRAAAGALLSPSNPSSNCGPRMNGKGEADSMPVSRSRMAAS